MLNQLREEVNRQVEASVLAGKDIKVGPVEMKVLDCGEFVSVAGFGRVEKVVNFSGPGSIQSLQAEVLSRIKAAFREEGPEAALKAIRERTR